MELEAESDRGGQAPGAVPATNEHRRPAIHLSGARCGWALWRLARAAALLMTRRSHLGHYDLVHRRGRGIQSKWHHLKFQRVAQELTGYRRVLDVGCGPGTLVGMLRRDHEAFGVDITEPQIEYANRVYAAARPPSSPAPWRTSPTSSGSSMPSRRSS